MNTFSFSTAMALLAIAVALPHASVAQHAPPANGGKSVGRIEAQDLRPGETYDRFIVRFTDGRTNAAAGTTLSNAIGARGFRVRHARRLAIGAELYMTYAPLSAADAQVLMDAAAKSGVVEFIDIDRKGQLMLTPSDPLYQSAWHYKDYTDGGINMPQAWDFSTGAGVVVAVIDSGFTSHGDLNGNVLPGYDFISDPASARDFDGRDSNPSDEGNWNPPDNSTWHGTFVGGIVGAVANTQHTIGVAHKAKLVPVRVSGLNGLHESDASDAIVWASGGSVDGVPANANPAEVLNLSFGHFNTDCSPAYQYAINIAVANGATVVVAAGNYAAELASTTSPANCANVVTVAASDRHGDLAHYSSFGVNVDITAPGGEAVAPHANCADADGCDWVYSLTNTGTTTPLAASSGGGVGTSFAAPHVSGIAALMQAAAPRPRTPARIEQLLKASAQPGGVGNCPGGRCGAGLLDGYNAVRKAFFDCTLEEWDASVGNVAAGAPYYTPTVARRLSDQCGIRAQGTGAYVSDTFPSSAASSFRFYFLPEGTSGTTKILEAKMPGGQVLFSATLAGNAVTFRNATGGALASPVAVRDNAWNSLQLSWSATSGKLEFQSAYVDPANASLLVRSALQTAEGVGASTDTLGRIDLGQISSTVQRAIHFDAYAQAAGTEFIPRPMRGDATGDGACDSDDTTALANEVLYSLNETGAPARGQPDCTEDGQLNSNDMTCLSNRILNRVLNGIPCD